jgi:hypothetical protein
MRCLFDARTSETVTNIAEKAGLEREERFVIFEGNVVVQVGMAHSVREEQCRLIL